MSAVLVCGHGRCGSSLVMQMLQAGGYPCFGGFPDFEPEELGLDRDIKTLLPLIGNRAAKILDPQLDQWPDMMDARVIWLDRDRNEQGRSHAKFLRLMCGIDIPGTAKRFAQSYGRDTAVALGKFRDVGVLPLRLRFDDLVQSPRVAVLRIAEHLRTKLDLEAMEAAVIPRDPRCRPDMSIEEYLIAAGRHWEAAALNNMTPEQIAQGMERCPTDALEFGVRFEALGHREPPK